MKKIKEAGEEDIFTQYPDFTSDEWRRICTYCYKVAEDNRLPHYYIQISPTTQKQVFFVSHYEIGKTFSIMLYFEKGTLHVMDVSQ